MPDLDLRGMTLEQLMGGLYDPTEPLPNVAGFDTLADTGTPKAVTRLVAWIEPQATIDYLIEHHGFAGCKRVLSGIARAASKLQLPMGSRVRSAAQAQGLPTF